MKFTIYKEERDSGMLYEAIACHAFGCDRCEDPDGIADATFFDYNFVPPLTEEGLSAMISIIDQLISQTQNNNKIIEYKGIEKSLALGMDQESSIELLSLLADIINDED